MPLSTFLKSAAGTCPFCNQKAGILSREHPNCRRTFQVGWNEMVNHAAQAAALHTFDEKTLRLSKAEIAKRSCRDRKTVSQAAEEGCGPLHCQQPPVIGRWYTILPPQRYVLPPPLTTQPLPRHLGAVGPRRPPPTYEPGAEVFRVTDCLSNRLRRATLRGRSLARVYKWSHSSWQPPAPLKRR